MLNIAVFASGRGTNFEAIARAVKAGKLPVRLALLISDNRKAPVIEKAKRYGVEVALVERQEFQSKREFEAKISEIVDSRNIGLIVLAGYMRLLGADFVKKYKGRIINIHPALLPSFKGTEAIKDAYEQGVRITGVTVHFVDEEMDHGPVILQKEVKVDEKDTPQTLEAKIHKAEHKLYPEAIRLFAEGRLSIEGRKVRTS